MDNLALNNGAIGAQVGTFYGTPIFSFDETIAKAQGDEESRLRIAESQILGLETSPELNPGETICKDNLIRRATTSEFLGSEFRAKDPDGTLRVPVSDAAGHVEAGEFVHWRPNGFTDESVLLYTEEAFNVPIP
jgi:hypothetical protein